MATDRRPWLGSALRWQALAASLAIGVASTFAVMGLRFDLGLQVGVLLAGIILVGFPHGAFDHLVAQPVLAPRLGRFWWLPFGVIYLGLAGLVGIGWTLVAPLTLVLFLAASVLHFGLGDLEDSPAPAPVRRWMTVLTYGALPILLPIAFHPAEAAPVLAAIGGIAEPTMLRALSGAMGLVPLWGACLVWVWHGAGQQQSHIVMTAVTAAGFVLLPPLIAFGLYFGLVHSPRHLLRLAAWHDPRDVRRAGWWAARIVVPASLVSAAGIAGLAWTGPEMSSGLLVPTFRIIAGLTLPHMLVTGWLDHDKGRLSERAAAQPGRNVTVRADEPASGP
ncbi:MAG: Brp/Blh family beta-carotene 15,15'-dioxygenase [Janthinobacterium lividum]